MRYYKEIAAGYLVSIGTGSGFEEINAEDYASIKSVMNNKPALSGNTDYRLREDLTWEAYEIEPPEPEEEELTDTEALEIILGGAV